MSIRSRVAVLLKARRGTGLCDICIRTELGLRNASLANEATRALAKGGRVLGFARPEGTCGLCGNRRLVICSTK